MELSNLERLQLFRQVRRFWASYSFSWGYRSSAVFAETVDTSVSEVYGVSVTNGENLMGEELLDFTRNLRRHMRRRTGRPWPRAHLTAAQLDLLRVVSQQPEIGVAAAATELGLAPNTVSTLVGQLLDTGILVREADPYDGRAVRLHLSNSAEKQLKSLRDQRSTLLRAALAELNARDLARIKAALPALKRVSEHLREETETTS